MKTKLVYIVNDIDFFKNHFFPIALNASIVYDITIISNKVDKQIVDQNPEIKQFKIPIKRSSINPIYDLELFFELFKILKRIKPFIIHNITIKPILYGSLAAKIISRKINIINSVTGLGYAITNNHFFIKTTMQILIKFLIPKKSHFLFLNKHDKEFYQNLGKGLRNNYTMVFGSGVDKKEFKYKKPQKKEKIEIVYTGRILRDKGIINLIDAVNLLEASLKPKIILKLYGSIDDQNPAHITRSELEKYLVPGFIEWLGFSSEIIKVLEKSDIYCLPSFREGNPKSIIEAMAIGRPILTTQAPGCEDTVEDGINGFKVPIGVYLALSKKLEILIKDEDLRIQMGINSRSLFEKKYTLENVIDQIHNAYNTFNKP